MVQWFDCWRLSTFRIHKRNATTNTMYLYICHVIDPWLLFFLFLDFSGPRIMIMMITWDLCRQQLVLRGCLSPPSLAGPSHPMPRSQSCSVSRPASSDPQSAWRCQFWSSGSPVSICTHITNLLLIMVMMTWKSARRYAFGVFCVMLCCVTINGTFYIADRSQWSQCHGRNNSSSQSQNTAGYKSFNKVWCPIY